MENPPRTEKGSKCTQKSKHLDLNNKQIQDIRTDKQSNTKTPLILLSYSCYYTGAFSVRETLRKLRKLSCFCSCCCCCRCFTSKQMRKSVCAGKKSGSDHLSALILFAAVFWSIFVALLHLHPTVLEPNFDLSLGEI